MKLVPGTPAAALLNAALLFGPLGYLFLDTTYAARGWWDADTAALHVLVAAAYGITALRLVTLARGRLQALLLVVTVLGVAGNTGVGIDTMQVGLGGIDLFDADGPANLFKTMGFFFPLTLLLGAFAVRGLVPLWNAALLALGAVLFPVAHVGNISWLAILDALVLVVALGSVFAVRHRLDTEQTAADAAADTVRRTAGSRA